MDRAQFGLCHCFVDKDQIDSVRLEIDQRIGNGGHGCHVQRFSQVCVHPCVEGPGKGHSRPDEYNRGWWVEYHRCLRRRSVVGWGQPLSQYSVEILTLDRFADKVIHA